MDRRKNRRVGARQAGAGRRPPRSPLARVSGSLETIFWRTVEALDALETKYAVVGGIAIGVRVAPRTTKDLDFAVKVADDAEAEAFVFALRNQGYVVDMLFQRSDGRLGTVRTWLPHSPSVLVDFLFATSRIEPEIVDAATREPFRDGRRAPVATASHLLAMKLKAGRKKDAPDIQSLIEGARPATLTETRKALRLMQSRGADPQRDLVGELDEAIAEVRRPDPDMMPVKGARLRRLRGR